MELQYIVSLVTVFVTLILGYISKKNTKISNKLIPIQDLLVGIIVALIEWAITKDFKTAIALSGLIALSSLCNSTRSRRMSGPMKLRNSSGEISPNPLNRVISGLGDSFSMAATRSSSL